MERISLIKHCYITRDKLSGNYISNITMVREDADEYREMIVRGILKLDQQTLLTIKDNSYYYIGTFDDVTGKFDLLDEYVKLLDAEDYIKKE